MTKAGVPEAPTAAQSIADLTNAVFDGVQDHIDRFAQDPRRLHDDGTLVLMNGESILHGSERKYGRLVLAPHYKRHKSELASAFFEAELFKRLFPTERLKTTGLAAILPDSFTPTSWDVGVFAERDYYPKGNTAHRIWAGNPTDEWGERHSIGVRLHAHFEAKAVPISEHHQFEIMAKQRFDKDEPAIFSVHKADVGVRSPFWSGDATIKWEDPKEYRAGVPVADEDLQQLAGFLALAKDLRPVVHSIAQVTSHRRFISGLTAQYFGNDSGPPSANTPQSEAA